MSMIKFPTQINPARLTVTLLRVDEIIRSPVTNVQQVVSRGNPAWQWTYEYKDLSESERDIVQAFLLKCKGSVNTFRVTDPGDYIARGSVSNWIDVFSNYGSFHSSVGSSSSKINSWFGGATFVSHHITEEQLLIQQWKDLSNSTAIRWAGHGVAGRVASLEVGASYVQRVKFFQNPDKVTGGALLSVGSGAIDVNISQGPVVRSTDNISLPFNVGYIESYYVMAVNAQINTGTSEIGDAWETTDYRLMRCALVSNSENLVTKSNEFDHVDWTGFNITVESGWMDHNPKGVNSGGWKMYGDSQTNTSHYFSQTITKVATEDIYCAALYVQADEHNQFKIEMMDASSNDVSGAFFNVASKTATTATNSGDHEFAYASVFDVSSGILKLSLRSVVGPDTALTARFFAVNSDGSDQFTNNGSAGVNIFGAALRKFPYPGQYVPTDATAVVGTDWQTGSNLIVAGLSPGDIIKTGQRFEIVNQFNIASDDLFERSEFKRTTKEVRVGSEGYVMLSFDPPIRNSPKTNRSQIGFNHHGETLHNPVIFHKPEMKARLVNGTIQYTEKSLTLTDVSFEVFEDMTE